jgi:DNA-binding LytR/AlgR family response regulator
LKLRIEVVEGLDEDEVTIRCSRVGDSVQKLEMYINSLSRPKIIFYKGQQEFYMPIEEIFFFETDSELVYAHTANDAFKVKLRLYELETILPQSFTRAAKGTIVNTSHIYSISRNLASPSQIRFTGTHKHVYVSRHYYQALKVRMNERRV